MHPKVVESFWSDLDFERYEGQELANIRITFLWAFTGPVVNTAGIFPMSRQFTQDVGLPVEWLHRLLTDFPRAFLRCERTNMVLTRNYIRYQIGIGPSLAKNAKMVISILHKLRLAPAVLSREVLALYPELHAYVSPTEALAKCLPSPTEALAKPFTAEPNGGSPSQGLGRGLQHQESQDHSLSLSTPETSANTSTHGSPSQGLGKPPAQEKEKEKAQAPAQGDARGASARPPGDYAEVPTVEEVIEWGRFDAIDEETCRAFFAYYDGLNWMHGNTRIGKPRSWLKTFKNRRVEMQGSKKTPRGSGRVDYSGADDIRAALQGEKNPARRKELQAQLEAMAR